MRYVMLSISNASLLTFRIIGTILVNYPCIQLDLGLVKAESLRWLTRKWREITQLVSRALPTISKDATRSFT